MDRIETLKQELENEKQEVIMLNRVKLELVNSLQYMIQVPKSHF